MVTQVDYRVCMRAHRAFSMVELLTALVLLVVGLAAFARAVAGVARLENDARIRRVIAAVFVARLDSLSGASCVEARSGDAWQDGVHEIWRVTPGARHVELTDTAVVPARPALSRALSASLACQP